VVGFRGTTTSQKCEAVPRRARIKAHRLFVSLNSRRESDKEEKRSFRGGPATRRRRTSGERAPDSGTWFTGVFKAHRLVYHSTLGLRVITKRREV